MSDDWIQKLAEQQRQREKKSDDTARTARDAQVAFEAAAAPFEEAVIGEIRKVVASYNAALGREDLIVPDAKGRVGRGSLEIHRGTWLEGSCNVSLHAHTRELVGEYRYKDDTGAGLSGTTKVPLRLVENAVRGSRGDGSPQATAQAIMNDWIGKFRASPPAKS